MDQYRLQVGIKTISARPRRVAAQRIIKALRGNSIVLILADELKSTGAEVEFFGQVYPFPRGPVTLAMRVGALLQCIVEKLGVFFEVEGRSRRRKGIGKLCCCLVSSPESFASLERANRAAE